MFGLTNIYKANAELKPDVQASYSCKGSDISMTIVKDANKDGVYDTYSIVWCNGTVSTYPICAIGDIRRWPPTGIPNREIFYSDFTNKTSIEHYYGFNSFYLICWFTKYADNDTVYYYDNCNQSQFSTGVDENNPNLNFNMNPNPAKDIINIGYSITQSGWVSINVYNEIGVIVTNIEEKYRIPGQYNLEFRLDDLISGTYFINVKIGQDNVVTRRLVIIK
jgi:hypothetical protein